MKQIIRYKSELNIFLNQHENETIKINQLKKRKRKRKKHPKFQTANDACLGLRLNYCLAFYENTHSR